MKKIAVLALAALVGWVGMAVAADAAIEQAKAEIQAKLAAQEARLSDLQAKLVADPAPVVPEYMTSIRRNAKVTIGGAMTTSYFYNAGTVETDTGSGYEKTLDVKTGSVEMSDLDFEVQVDINENMDAYLDLKLHNTDADYGFAESAWVRWKNIANTGFGVKAGRDNLVFGDGDAATGYLYNFTNNDGDGHSWWYDYDGADGAGFLPHNYWDYGGVTQIAPYWEGLDGKLLIETSFFASMWNNEGAYKASQTLKNTRPDGTEETRARNYGAGSMSARVTWTPLEDLHFSASVVNYHANGIAEWDAAADELSKNNTAVGLAFAWRPSFLSRVNIWSQYVRGWNVNHYAGTDSDALNFGFSVDLTEKASFFAQGDYLHSSFDYADRRDGGGSMWAAYAGLSYDLGNGLWMEGGWRHETGKRSFDDNGTRTREKIKNNLLYGSLGFEF